jgi:transposase InsO family protein
VAVDKFSKWIEARPIVNVCSEASVSFFTDIIYRFDIPNTIITDNSTQFTGKKFLNFCDDNHIRVDWSIVAHLKTNGQVERANDMILQVLKPRIFKQLDKFRARWVAELPSVLWSLRTTPSWATGFTPFFMVHGSEAVLPTDIDYGSPRVRAYIKDGNQVALEDAIDQLDEARDVAMLRSAKYQQALWCYHERNMRPCELHVGDFILRRVQGSKDQHKLSPPWEGPFIIHEVLRPGTYKIQYEDGRVITNAWNIEHLRPFYP